MAFLEMIYLKAITLAAEKIFPCVYKGNRNNGDMGEPVLRNLQVGSLFPALT